MNHEDYVRLEGRLTVVLHYDVGELLVRADNLGASLAVERAGLLVRVELPNADGEFENGLSPPSTLPIRGHHGEPPDARYVVGVVQVQVDMRRGLGDEGPGNAESVLIRQAEPAAAAAVRTLLDWARTNDGQVWLSPPHVDTKRAVLLAATGLEVKAPAVLRAAADPPTRMLLDILYAYCRRGPPSSRGSTPGVRVARRSESNIASVVRDVRTAGR